TSLSLVNTLFHEASSGTADALGNATLRRMDGSWRLNPDHRNELIVMGRARSVAAPAEEIFTSTEGLSPTLLWLKGTPAAGPRTPVPGLMRQETTVRIYVPIKPSR
ncbi:MAG: hypothetical protein ACRCZF_20600, partial [Gemmataceae bacterium]